MRKKIVAGNWKMHKDFKEGLDFIESCVEQIRMNDLTQAEVIFATPFIHLRKGKKEIKKLDNCFISAQNCHWENSGAYTGEISASMIASTGATHCIIGHSERRQYFSESNEQLAKKVNQCLQHELIPIFCVGETLDIREAHRHYTHIELQVVEGLFHLNEEEIQKVIIAYEPVWAIGTGVNATPQQAQEIHAFIRRALEQQYSVDIANHIRILYGGSVKPSNAAELFSQTDVDGGLVGGASLNQDDFLAIIRAAQ
jgi:triosephosphate isomerase